MNTTEASNSDPPLGLRLSELLGVSAGALDVFVDMAQSQRVIAGDLASDVLEPSLQNLWQVARSGSQSYF